MSDVVPCAIAGAVVAWVLNHVDVYDRQGLYVEIAEGASVGAFVGLLVSMFRAL